MWDFLCSFKHEGFSPVILRSKDVYGYSSCRSVVPDKNATGVKRVKGLANAKKKAPGLRRERKKKRGRKSKKPNTRVSSDSTLPESLEANSLDTGIVYCQRTLEEIWRAATPKIITVKTVVVKDDVSSEKNTAAARRRAEKLMHLNLTPVLKLRRLNMPQ
ncbi:CC71L protein, partial [Polyodon spathula]|nr:CC71L protein [Polyodon spathula]